MRIITPPEALAWQVFRGSEAISAGLATPRSLRGSALRRVRYDVYADARLDLDHRLACRAAALTLPPTATLAGPSAAYLLGVEHAAEFADPVHIIVPSGERVSPRVGIVVHSTDLAPSDIRSLGWCTIANPARTAWDLGAWSDPLTAVPIIDSLLGSGVVDRPALAEIALRLAGTRGSRRATQVFAYADGRAQSPPESRLRVRIQLAGLPAPIPQCPVRVGNGVTVHPDLGWPEYRVAAEYDGVWHATTDQLHRDRRRLNLLVAAGWSVLHITSQRMARDFHGFVRELRTALIANGWSAH